jgi:hypothetical protein
MSIDTKKNSDYTVNTEQPIAQKGAERKRTLTNNGRNKK